MSEIIGNSITIKDSAEREIFTVKENVPAKLLNHSIVHEGVFQSGEVILYPSATGFAEAEFQFPHPFYYAGEPVYMTANILSMDGHMDENHLWHVTAYELLGRSFKVRVKNIFNNNGTYVKVVWMAHQATI